jgi:hypothetical protein
VQYLFTSRRRMKILTRKYASDAAGYLEQPCSTLKAGAILFIPALVANRLRKNSKIRSLRPRLRIGTPCSQQLTEPGPKGVEVVVASEFRAQVDWTRSFPTGPTAHHFHKFLAVALRLHHLETSDAPTDKRRDPHGNNRRYAAL